MPVSFFTTSPKLLRNRSEPRRMEPQEEENEKPFEFPEAEAKNKGLWREVLNVLRR